MFELNDRFVSVIMSVYSEKSEWLRKSIESILGQTWENFEFLIVNDNPDNVILKQVLNEYEKKDRRIKVIQNEKNIGLAKSMNVALKNAKGKYIARMDADDISVPERLEKEIRYLEKYSLDMVASNRTNISEDGKVIEQFGKMPQGRNVEKLLPYRDMIIHPSVLLKREILEKLGGYRELVPAEDYDLWLRMLTNGCRIGIINMPLLYYRVRKNGISATDYYKQFLVTKYVKRLFLERKNGNVTDSFSKENLNKYLEKRYKERKKENFNKARLYFNTSICEWKNGRKGRGLLKIIRGFTLDWNCASEFLSLSIFELRKKYYVHREETIKSRVEKQEK